MTDGNALEAHLYTITFEEIFVKIYFLKKKRKEKN